MQGDARLGARGGGFVKAATRPLLRPATQASWVFKAVSGALAFKLQPTCPRCHGALDSLLHQLCIQEQEVAP